MADQREHPILFSAPMVGAILEGRKTQTRRALKPQPFDGMRHKDPVNGRYVPRRATNIGPCAHFSAWAEDGVAVLGDVFELKYEPGVRLWVREAHALDGERCWYREGHAEAAAKGPRVDVRWRPSIHMPRWASRITLEVTGVKVERLQDISEDDAFAEGIETDAWDMAPVARDYSQPDAWFVAWSMGISPPNTSVEVEDLSRRSFRSLWESINGPASWDANPWVVAISFNRVTP